ncbi:unnamed protein product [Urochloa decumbens]|uniref:Uncharacterized protein n=1 Tax=Urochloa decumbens TaxID=240449 RepID=A0ABC9HBB1_9POAL
MPFLFLNVLVAHGGTHVWHICTKYSAKKLQGRRCHGNKRRLACQCIASSIHGMEAYGPWSAMEKATKWDGVHHHHPSPLMEAELEKARCHISDLEEERRVTSRRLERFLRKLREEKASWKARVKDKARHAVAALREERAHRRQLEQANAKLTREAAEARKLARQQAQSYEAERKAREVMEEACSELTREVEEDQAEVELLRRECLRMREEMEEERRMLQMAEVWREERVQMKLSDAKLALQTKYDHLAQLQAQMEAFLRNKDKEPSAAAAAVSAPSSSLRPRGRASQRNNEDYSVDADSVLEHFRRKEEMEMETQMQMQTNKHHANRNSPASNNDSDCNSNVSPATDLFLAKVEDDDDDEYANGGGSSDYACSWFGTSDRSAAASVANGNTGGFEARSSAGASRRSLGKNTALIRRLWRSAIAESRTKAAAGWSPSSDNRRSSAEAPPAPPPPQQSKQSLRDKLMEARMMDDHKPDHAHALLVLKHKT